MPQDAGVVQDSVTDFFCTSYSTEVPNCLWGSENDALEWPTLAGAQAAAADMNLQVQSDRFIGKNPKPR